MNDFYGLFGLWNVLLYSLFLLGEGRIYRLDLLYIQGLRGPTELADG
jgi:hypothetical protein